MNKPVILFAGVYILGILVGGLFSFPIYFSLSMLLLVLLTTIYLIWLKRNCTLLFLILFCLIGLINFQLREILLTQNRLLAFANQHVKVIGQVADPPRVIEDKEFENLDKIFFNGKEVLSSDGKVETTTNLGKGRNIIQLIGYVTPETVTSKTTPEIIASGEVKVLVVKPFIDVPMDHWAVAPIYLSETLGLVKGYPDGAFKPDKGISRAELVTLLVRTLPVDIDNELLFSPFKDVADSHWAAKYIAYGVEDKLVTGYPDGKFLPNKVLTRAEGVTILARYSGLPEQQPAQVPFFDLPNTYWANKYIAPAKKAGLLEYLTGKAFEPSTQFTRAEACEVLYNTKPITKQVDLFWETGKVTSQKIVKQATTQEATPQTIATTQETVVAPTTSEAK